MAESRAPEARTFTIRRALEIDAGRTMLSTGSTAIDGLLGGGLKTGEMVEFFGASNTGKTQLGMQAALSVATRGFASAFIDTEAHFRPERLSSMCEARGISPDQVLRSVYHIRAESTRRQSGAIDSVRKTPGVSDCKLLVVDTLTKNFSLELGGEKAVGRRQTMLGAYLNRLARDASLRDRAVLLLNRVASIDAEGESSEIDIGGQTVRHFVQKAVYLKREGNRILAEIADARSGERVDLRITTRGIE